MGGEQERDIRCTSSEQRQQSDVLETVQQPSDTSLESMPESPPSHRTRRFMHVTEQKSKHRQIESLSSQRSQQDGTQS